MYAPVDAAGAPVDPTVVGVVPIGHAVDLPPERILSPANGFGAVPAYIFEDLADGPSSLPRAAAVGVGAAARARLEEGPVELGSL